MERTNADFGDPVPWDLDDKFNAYEFVRARGWKVPRAAKCATVREAIEAGEAFGPRFVVKQPDLHSSRGVYVLEKRDDGTFLDLMTARVLKAAEVAPWSAPPDHWTVEEYLPPICRGAVLPLDYKVYAFRGQVTHVMQMDRAVRPVCVAAFDGAFLPLTFGQSVHINRAAYRRQGHVLPLHAPGILAMARDLSKAIDTAFVRVDCFDTPEGPVFGEFTFTPGAEDVGTIHYSGGAAAKIDRALAGDRVEAMSGFDVDLEAFYEEARRHKGPIFTGDRGVLALAAASAIQMDVRYGRILLQQIPQGKLGAHFALAARLVGFINGDHEQAAQISAALTAKSGFLASARRAKEFAEIARNFEKQLAEALKTLR